MSKVIFGEFTYKHDPFQKAGFFINKCGILSAERMKREFYLFEQNIRLLADIFYSLC